MIYEVVVWMKIYSINYEPSNYNLNWCKRNKQQPWWVHQVNIRVESSARTSFETIRICRKLNFLGLYNQLGGLGYGSDLNLNSGRRDSLSDFTNKMIGQPSSRMMNSYGNLNPLTGLTGGLAGTVSPPGIGNTPNLLSSSFARNTSFGSSASSLGMTPGGPLGGTNFGGIGPFQSSSRISFESMSDRSKLLEGNNWYFILKIIYGF